MLLPLLSGRHAVLQAEELSAAHGAGAAQVAMQAAGQARARDNAVHFCHWRNVERLCRLPMSAPDGVALN